MEATPTWYGMFLPDGAPLEAVDVMTHLWSGHPPKNLAPTVQPLVIEGESKVDPAEEVRVRAAVTDPEGGDVRVRMPMPFYLYRDGFEGMPWAPSGWMGATESLTLDGDHRNDPHEGSACIEMRFVGEVGTWVGVAWQHPANDWGEQAGGYDLSAAKYLEVWARGKYSGERISIGVGLLGKDKTHPDSSKTTAQELRLTREWKRYRIRLKRHDLSSIKTGFVVTVRGQGSPVTVYLDGIRFVRR